MKLFGKIFTAVFLSFIIVGSLVTYISSLKQISDAQKNIVEQNRIISRFLAKEIEVDYVQSRWPFENLARVSESKYFLFWWVIRDDGVIHLADKASFMGTLAYNYLPWLVDVKENENVTLNPDKNYGIFVKTMDISKKRWMFLLGFSLSEILEIKKSTLISASLNFVLIMVILGAIIYFIVKHFTQPIRELVQGAAIIGKGDLAYRVKIESHDELRTLADSFNQMTENLQKTTVSRDKLIKEINERKRAEEESRTILRTAMDGFWITDLQGRFLDVNDAYCRLTGYTRGELLKMRIEDIEAMETRQETVHRIQKIVTIGRDRFESRHIRKDGKIVDFVISANYSKTEGGRLFVFLHDITEHNKIEEELWESKYRYRAIVDNSILGVAVMDTNYRIIMVNPTFAKLFNKTTSDFKGKYCFNEFEKRETVCVHCPGARAMGSCKTEEVETQGVRDDGIRFDVKIRAIPFFKRDGILNGFIEMVEDITERKRAEEELKNAYKQLKATQSQLVQSSKMAAVGQLASGVAHEINNPLTGVLNNVQLIKIIAEQKKEFNIEDFKKFLNIIEESAKRCVKITRALLDFSHASKRVFSSLSLNELVDKVLIIVGQEMKLVNISIQKDFAPDLPLVSGDSQLLQQVIFNIISNARWAIQKKSDKAGGSINIKSYVDSQNKTVCLAITDTGIGIPQENLTRMFEPFFTTKEVGEGTGLGLAVGYNIIKEHKGTLEVTSEVGIGTTFKIELPAEGGEIHGQ